MITYFGSLDIFEYIYGADGSKLQKKVTEASANKTVDYLSGFQYENGNMEFFPTAEGYVKVTETGAVGKVFSYNGVKFRNPYPLPPGSIKVKNKMMFRVCFLFRS